MISRMLLTTAVAVSLVATPATRAAADAGDFIAGAIAGAIVNHAVRNQSQQRVYRQTTTTPRKTVKRTSSIPSTQEGRQIQTSLNYFGFNAGSVDGQLGRKSREAVSQYQAYLGYPITGQLSVFEQDLLITSYNRALAGGYATQQMIAANPEGTRGLLKSYRTEMAGGVPAGAVMPQTTMVVAPAPQVAPAPIPVVVAAAPDPAPAPLALPVAAPAPALPSFATTSAPLPNLFGGAVPVSLADHCDSIARQTARLGGPATAQNLTDANVALNEQFCVARSDAIAEGSQLAQGLGATPDQLTSHCAAYGQQMKPHVAALSVADRDSVLRDVSSFVAGTNIPSADLAATAKVCMSVGYDTENLDQAVGSGLILVALGEEGYAELMGHHLSQGIGAGKRTDLAGGWFDTGMAGAARRAVFAPADPERLELLRRATASLRSGGQEGLLPVALPSFSVSQ